MHMKRILLFATALVTLLVVGCNSDSAKTNSAEQWLVNNLNYAYYNDGTRQEVFYLNSFLSNFDEYLFRYDLKSGAMEQVTYTPDRTVGKWDGFSTFMPPSDKGLVEPCNEFKLMGFYRVFRNPAAENQYLLSYDTKSGEYKVMLTGNGFRIFDNCVAKFIQSWGWNKYALRRVELYDKSGNMFECPKFIGEIDGKPTQASVYIDSSGEDNMFVLIGDEKDKDKDYYSGHIDREGNFNLSARYVGDGEFNGKIADGKLEGVISLNGSEQQVSLAPESGSVSLPAANVAKSDLPLKEDVVQWIKDNIPYVVDKANNTLYLINKGSMAWLTKVDLESGESSRVTLTSADGVYNFDKFNHFIIPEDKGYQSENPSIIFAGYFSNKETSTHRYAAVRYDISTNQLTELINDDWVYAAGQCIMACKNYPNVYPSLVERADFYDANMQKISPRIFKGTIKGKPATAELVISANGELIGNYYIDNKPNMRTVLYGKVDALGTAIASATFGYDAYEEWRFTLKDGVLNGNFKYSYAFTKRSGDVTLTEQK